MNKWKLAIIIVAILLLASYAVAPLLVKRSDAFAMANQFLKSSPLVQNNIGNVSDISLKPFGYSLQYSGARGNAHFEFKIKGTRASGSAYVELRKKGDWQIIFANLMIPRQTAIELLQEPLP